MNKLYYISALAFLFFANITLAQNPFNQLTLEYWDSKKGMPYDLNLNAYQTMDGFIWTTSYSGLLRFDGVTFTSFNSRNTPLLKSDVITSLLTETADGVLWIPTPNSGLLAYKNGVFTAHLSEYSQLLYRGKTDNEEILLAADGENSGTVLFNTQNGSHRIITADDKLNLLKTGNLIYTKNRTDSKGNKWIYGGINKLNRFFQDSLYAIGSEQGISDEELLLDVLVDTKERTWLSTRAGGLFLWDGQKFKTFPGMENIMFRTTRTTGNIFEDADGGIWALAGSGLAYLPQGDDRFWFYTYDENPLTLTANNILQDYEGNLWFASAHGIFKLSQSKFKNYANIGSLTENRVEAVCALEDHKYLIATDGKLFLIDGDDIREYPFKDKRITDITDDPIHIIQASNGDIWVTYWTGKIVKLTETRETLYLPSFNNQARYVYEDSDGKIYFGLAFAGIGYIDDQNEIALLDFPKIDFTNIQISSIRKLQNGHWLITSHNNGFLTIDQAGNPTHYNDQDGLISRGFFNSCQDEESVIWLSSSSGITRLKDGVIDNIDFNSGLPENAIFQYIPDKHGYVWFPSTKGLLRAKKQELIDYLDNGLEQINWEIFDDGDGMINRQCVGARHADITLDGRLLVPTYGGLVELNPSELNQNEIPPSVVIHQFLWNEHNCDLNERQKFEPGDHRFIFSFSGLSLVAPKKVRFKFMLEGYDPDWIEATGDRRAFYTNLPFGSYTFKVIAANNDGVWNEEGDAITFTINRPWWRTWWAYLGYLLAAAIVMWTIIKIQRDRAIRIEREKAKDRELAQAKEIEKAYTELKSTQAQLIQSEKMASLGELTAGIAHEIQNPLNFVNNFSEVSSEMIDELDEELDNGDLEEVKAISKDLKQNLEKITHHGKRADSIVKGMLQHSRAGTGEKVPTDINALCDEYMRLAYHGLRAKDKSFNADYELVLDDSVGLINVVPQDISRVILNIVTNAFQACADLQSRQEDDTTYAPKVTCATRSDDDQVTITISDNGGGIPQDVIDKIFQPFFTTKPTGQGTGLGLSMAYDIVKAHGGELRVESPPISQVFNEGSGTRFLITLPIV